MEIASVYAGKRMAPQVGLEPTTLRLTAGCSAIELLRRVMKRNVSLIITSRGWSENQWAMAAGCARCAVISVGATVQRASCGHCRIPEYVSAAQE